MERYKVKSESTKSERLDNVDMKYVQLNKTYFCQRLGVQQNLPNTAMPNEIKAGQWIRHCFSIKNQT